MAGDRRKEGYALNMLSNLIYLSYNCCSRLSKPFGGMSKKSCCVVARRDWFS